MRTLERKPNALKRQGTLSSLSQQVLNKEHMWYWGPDDRQFLSKVGKIVHFQNEPKVLCLHQALPPLGPCDVTAALLQQCGLDWRDENAGPLIIIRIRTTNV